VLPVNAIPKILQLYTRVLIKRREDYSAAADTHGTPERKCDLVAI
jgi:hypothetical protein